MTSTRERILARLQELGADPKRSLGQNFLVSDHVIARILQAVQERNPAALVEVGPGLGALTEGLLALRLPLTAIELDRRFSAYWRERFVASNLVPAPTDALLAVPAPAGWEAPYRLIEHDALQLDWQSLSLPSGTLFISNLPYQISSSLVIERSLAPCGVEDMVLMFQKEVAQRLAARPRSEEYGLLTVIAQTFWRVEFWLEAGPRDFFPAPKVASRVMTFKRRETPWVTAKATPNGYLKFVKAGFSRRRKLLLKNLLQSFWGGERAGIARAEAFLTAEGLSLQVRAEELDPSQFLRLYLSVL